MSASPSTDCYCDLWKEKPGALRESGLPEGFCGICDTEVNGRRCGRPGHMHSGPGPFTFAYCDEHPPGQFIHFGCVALVALLLVAAGIGAVAWWWFL